MASKCKDSRFFKDWVKSRPNLVAIFMAARVLQIYLLRVSKSFTQSPIVITEKDYYKDSLRVTNSRQVTIDISRVPYAVRKMLVETLYNDNFKRRIFLKTGLKIFQRITYKPKPAFLSMLRNVNVEVSFPNPKRKEKSKVLYSQKSRVVGPLINKTVRRNCGVLLAKPRRTAEAFSHLENVVPMMGPTANNFGHFICEHITKLRQIEEVFGSVSECNVVLPDAVPWKIELLRWVGVPDKNIYVFGNDFLANTIYISSAHPVYMRDFEIKVEDISWVKNKLSAYAAQFSVSSPRIALVRRPPSGRSVSNYTECYTVLKEYGFEVLEPGELNIADKARVFGSVEYVFSTIGSGVFNSFFCGSRPKILFASNNYFTPHMFHVIFDALQYEVFHLHDNSPREVRLDPTASVYVDTERLSNTLNSLFARCS